MAQQPPKYNQSERKPHLLEVNTALTGCTTGDLVGSLSRHFSERGWDVTIAYGRRAAGEQPTNLNLLKIGNRLQHYTHALATRLMDMHGLMSKNATKKLCRFIETEKPDIIHLHNIHGYWLNYQILFETLRKHNIPIVWTLHDCWPMTGHCSHFLDVGCTEWKTGCRTSCCPAKRNYPSTLGLSRNKDNFSDKKKSYGSLNNMHIITVSDWMNSIARQSMLAGNEIHTIHNGVDMDIFRRMRADEMDCYLPDEVKEIDNNKKIVLTAANAWYAAKGYDAIVNYSRRMPRDVVLICVGNCSKISNKLKSIKNRIIVLDRVSDPKTMAALFNRADLFFNPSRVESMSMVNVEAIACGTPVATSAVSGMPETVNKEVGTTFDPYNYDEMVEIINRQLTVPTADYAIMREFIKTNFEKTKQNNKYLTLFEQLIYGK